MLKDRHAAKDDLSAEYVRTRLQYDPITGVFRWLPKQGSDKHVRSWNARHADKTAGYQDKRGYVFIRIDGGLYLAHRLALLITNGVWPPLDVDHEDRVPNHNWLTNLRPATTVQNSQNTTLRSNNTSGVKGVSFNKKTGKWRVMITVNRKTKYVGEYLRKDDAAQSYLSASAGHFGQFATTGV